MFCPKCGQAVEATWDYCRSCGTKLNVEANDIGPADDVETRTILPAPTPGEAPAVSPPRRKRSCALGCLLLFILFIVVFKLAAFTYRAPSESMVPSYLVGDLLVVSKVHYWFSQPYAGDVVILHPPAFALEPDAAQDITFIKRVVGTPGQVIEIKNRKLFRDGVPINEPYLNKPIPYGFQAVDCRLIEYPPKSGQFIPIVRDASGGTMGKSLLDELVKPEDMAAVWDYPAQKIPAGKFLVLGDNRDGSFDGRFWGLIDRADISGKVILSFWPLSRFGIAN